MNKKILIGIVTVFVVAITAILIFVANKRVSHSENPANENQTAETNNKVEEIKSETGATASDELYEVQQEYDGREILVIKPDIQFKTVLTGILKNGKPTKQDIEQLDLSKFHKGVWISETSRSKFLQILKKCKVENFEIDDNGYLYKKENNSNEFSTKLEDLINLDKLTVIDITGTCYIRDEMTGDIVEYPFKDMDLYQVSERFETQGSTIIIITTNDVEEIDILKAICE